jgi:hypothetical protein
MDKDYQAECDMRSLIEAKKIMADKPRYAAALKKCKEQMAQMATIAEKKGQG